MEAKRFIGIDLHRDCFTACVRLENGREYLKKWKLEEMPKFAAKLRPADQVAVEMTGNTRLFHDQVAPLVDRVVAVNPTQFQVITHSVKKTDPNDARLLALYLAPGFSAVRFWLREQLRGIRAAVLCVAVFLVPYLVYVAGTGDFRVGAFARLVLQTFESSTPLGTPDAMRLFAQPSRPEESRALGWDTVGEGRLDAVKALVHQHTRAICRSLKSVVA